MKNFTIKNAQGITVEFWLRQTGLQDNSSPILTINSENATVYKVQEGANFFSFYHYTHYGDADITLSYDSSITQISLCYYYDKYTVYQTGVTYLIDSNGLKCYSKKDLSSWYAKESFRPQLHFSPFKSWMNDPNGLCKIGDFYHLFYQFHPNSTEWGPMHWGHAISHDLISWTHLPVFNHPEHNLPSLGATGGAFSGTTFIDKKGQPTIFYTERLPAYDLYKDYIEIQKKATIDSNGIKAVNIQSILDQKPELVGCDFRDPKVWFDSEYNCYRMILGSVHDGHPSMLQFVSPDSENWKFKNVLYKAPDYFAQNSGRCVECPDFFALGDKWVLIFGIVGYQEPETKRHNLLYALVGTFKNNEFHPEGEIQVLDFATEYYALQTFNDGQRQLGIAWLFNWAMSKPVASVYNGEMSIPKEITININNKVAMRPVIELERYVEKCTEVQLSSEKNYLVDNGKSLRIKIQQGLHFGEALILEGNDDEWISISYRDGYVLIEDTVLNNVTYHTKVSAINDLDVIFDAGIVELFINQGETCATRRSYKLADCKKIKMDAISEKKVIIETLRTSW
ncbi:GH32 C-terminal domain-containing protein [Klebsiella aerogenes]